MALILSKANIVNGNIIQAADVSQSIDAFTGLVAYDLTITGSLNATGSVITGSISNATDAIFSNNSNTIKVNNVATVNSNFRLMFASEAGLPAPNNSAFAIANVDSGSDGSGLYYNPSTDTLYATNFVGTSSYINTASFALTSSIANNVNFSYTGIDDITFTASANPFPVFNLTPYNIYVFQSLGNILGLRFLPGNDGQIVNFTPNWQALNLDLTTIEVTASSANIFGIGGVAVTIGNAAVANTLIGSMVPTNNVNNLMFQYIGNPTVLHPSPGWYLINNNAT